MKTRKKYIIPALNVERTVVSSMMAVSIAIKAEDDGVTETSDVWTKEETDWDAKW